MKRSTKIIAGLGLAGIAAMSSGYILFPGSPKWPLSGGFHYVATLRPFSFGDGTAGHSLNQWNNAANWALSDMRDVGDTSFRPGILRANDDWTNHGDGKNVWIRFNRPNDTYLAVAFVRWSGSTMTDCDIWFNTRYQWTTSVYGSDVEPARGSSPYDFRTVARHEALHAVGFEHENRTLANMNSIYSDGAGVPDHQASGMMPHATDKHGLRVLYPAATSVTNLHAGRWRNPSTSTGSSAARRLSISGSWAAGTSRTVPFWLSNQGNATVAGGSSGVRVGIYLSTNSIISTADARVGEYTFGGDWGAHAAGYYNLNATVPSNFAPGTYYVGVIFDNRGIVTESGTGGFENDNDSIVGRITVTNSERVLTVTSTNPTSGVPITVSRTDRNNAKDGSTTFSRSYWGNTTVSLTAPTTASSNPFKRWWLGSSPQTIGNRVLNVNLNANRSARAEYYVYTPGTFRAYGTGCPGTGGRIPVLRGSGRPEINQVMGFQVSNARPFTPGAFYLGISNRAYNGARLPLDLSFIGMIGCTLDTSIEIQVPIATNASGIWNLSGRWPNNASDIGRHFYFQTAIYDPGTRTPTKVVHTNAIDAGIGGVR